jgi:hypothetical protein
VTDDHKHIEDFTLMQNNEIKERKKQQQKNQKNMMNKTGK